VRRSRLFSIDVLDRSNADDRTDILAKAGFAHRLADGLYTLLPLGQRVLQRISAMLRRRLEGIAAQEVSMPLLQPLGLWERVRIGGQTRAESFGRELFRVNDAMDEQLILAPTHEEIAAVLTAASIRRSSDLPRTIFQIQPRFRNQVAPLRGGLLLTREFFMADAYSFHANEDCLDTTYDLIRNAFFETLSDCGVMAEFVAADSGAMGGGKSEELVVSLPGTTSAVAVKCGGCGYAASLDIAKFARRSQDGLALLDQEEIIAPDGLSVEALAMLVGASTSNRLNCTPFVTGGRLVLAVVPGDIILNPVKLRKALTAVGYRVADLRPATETELIALGGYETISLVYTPDSVLVVADESVRARSNFHMLAPRVARVLNNLNIERDFHVDVFGDIGSAPHGASCWQCGAKLNVLCGIEVGHIFKLGTLYSAAFGAKTREMGVGDCEVHMGSYGLGLTRLLATVVETKRDARGLVWPTRVAPYSCIIVPLTETPEARFEAEDLYRQLSQAQVAVLLDDSHNDSDEKLRYADFIGIPYRISITGNAGQAATVVRERATAIEHLMGISSVVDWMLRISRETNS
jgi:prolyl-tRNA synthetase